ncbi:MAG TPA: hypothetical protein VET27_18465 [Mycobacterium sp.]|nr:hypothetical protein [Mycobacterium sp.]
MMSAHTRTRWGLAPVDATVAVSAVVLVLSISVFAAFACATVIRLIDHQVRHGDIEPLTGLLPREAFDDQVATLIGARSR